MQELEQLIEKFWADRTTPEENRRLIQLLKEYQMTIGAPDEHDGVMEHYSGYGLQPDKALSILQNIHSGLGLQEQKPKRALVRPLTRWITAAASVSILVVSAVLWTGSHHPVRSVVAATTPPVPNLVRLANGSDSVMSLSLEDGSTVQLEKNSSLSYYQPFIRSRRDISLKGIAIFKVAKDKKRPFTVYAGGIATTALGTKFLVNATDDRKVLVRLLEGKVMISTAAGTSMTMKDIYLSPGQEFSFDKNSLQYAVNTIPDRAVGTPGPIHAADKPGLVFQKEPLGNVLEKVGRLYKVSLTFRKKDLDGLYFTGTFLKSDNLNIVLSTICNVNDLLVTKNGDAIIITRSH
jgi:transmembrane sensor